MALVTAVLANALNIVKIGFKYLTELFDLNSFKTSNNYSNITLSLLLFLIVWISFISHPILFLGFLLYGLSGIATLIVTEDDTTILCKGWAIWTLFFVVMTLCVGHMIYRPDLNLHTSKDAKSAIVQLAAPESPTIPAQGTK